MAGRKQKPSAELTLISDGDKIKEGPVLASQNLTEEEKARLLNKPVDELLLAFERRLDELEVGYRNLTKLTKMVYDMGSETMQAVNEVRNVVGEIKKMCFAFHGMKQPVKPEDGK